MYDIVIIGAGTAGLTAAIYALRSGKRVVVIEEDNFGGQIVESPRIENYPGIPKISGSEFAEKLLDQACALGAETELERVFSIQLDGKLKKVITNASEYICKSVIIATGVKHRRLGLPGEDNLVGEGVSYCAVCDGVFFKGKDVAVVGGGNSALEEAVLLSEYCEKVYLIHRRDQFRAEAPLARLVESKENIKILFDSIAVELVGENTLKGIKVENVKTKDQRELKVEALFVNIGQIPENHEFEGLIELDDDGYIRAGEDCTTNIEGVFTAGDCRSKEIRQLTTAAADGAVAGLAACRYTDHLEL